MRKLIFSAIMIIGMVAMSKAENVLTFPNISGTPNSTVTVSVSLDNTDEVTAYELFLPLGEQLHYVDNSLQILRTVNHNFVAKVDDNVLHIMVYSQTSALLTGNSGTIFTFNLLLGSTLGTYALNPSTVYLSDPQAQAVTYSIVNGSVTISNNPHINCPGTLNMNPSSVNVTASELFAIFNDGAADLNINNITFSGANAANCSATNVPSSIPAGETAYISVNYNGNTVGNYSATMTIASNNPNGNVEVAVSGSRYSDGIQINAPLLSYINDNVVWTIELNNVTTISGMVMASVTFTYPSSYTVSYDNGDVVFGERVATSFVQPSTATNSYTIMFMGTISGNSGTLLEITMHPNSGAKSDNYEITASMPSVGMINLSNANPSSTFTAYSDETAWTLPSGEYGEPGTFTECIDALNNVVGGGNLSLSSNITVSQNITIDSDINIDYGDAKELHTITVNHGVSLLNYADVNAKYILHIDNSQYPDGSRWNADWHDIASPVADHAISSFTTGDYDFFRYYEPEALWQYHAGASGPFTAMESGRGYLVAFDTERDLEFTGSMRHGDVNYGLTRTEAMGGLAGFNLAGNPYPSYLDWHTVYDATSNISNTYYLWDEDHGQYATYTYSTPSIGTFDLSRYISPGQGFFVICNSTSGTTLNFSDLARSNESYATAPFRDEYPTIKINVAGKIFGEDETILMLNCPQTSGATKLKSMYDMSPSLYIPYAGEDYAILFLNEENQDVKLPFSFEAGQNDEFTMSFSITNYDGDYLELEDLLTGVKINLLEENTYTFYGNPDDAATRFRINFRDITGVEDITSSSQRIYLHSEDNLLTIGNLSGKSQIRIIDIRGIVMAEKTGSESVMEINTSNYVSGTYIVQVVDENGSQNAKVIIR